MPRDHSPSLWLAVVPPLSWLVPLVTNFILVVLVDGWGVPALVVGGAELEGSSRSKSSGCSWNSSWALSLKNFYISVSKKSADWK